MKPFQANCPEALIEAVRWVSTAVLKSVVAPLSRASDGETMGVMSFGVEMETPDEVVLW
jgi:hypothetical protein